MKKNLILISLFLLSASISAQVNRYGVPIIRNYPTRMTGGSEQNWCITRDVFGNLYFGNQDMGVVRYDGTRWNTIRIGKNPRIHSLAADSSGIVYVGGAFEFGYIQPDVKGKPEYVSLASRIDSLPEIRNVVSIEVIGNKVLFLSPGFIYLYDSVTDSLSRINLKEQNVKTAMRMIRNNDRIIIADYNEGLFEFKGNKVSALPGGDYFRKKDCTVLLPYDDNKLLIGTFFHGLHLYDYDKGIVDSSFVERKIFNRLKDVMVYAGAKLGNDLFAIGTTQEDGILVLDRNGELVQQINRENSDIEDITIYSMYCDYRNNSELWIAAEGYISKAYLNLPVTFFSGKHGIATVINDICESKGKVYLSTDAGILQSFLTPENTVGFKPIPDANVQVFPLIVMKSPSWEFLLAGSLNGLLEISGGKVRNLPPQAVLGRIGEGQSDRYNARKIIQSVTDPSLIYVGLESKGISMLRFDGKKWIHVNRIGAGIPGNINGIAEKKDGGIWFITDDPNALYSASFTPNDTVITKYDSDKGISSDINSVQYLGDELYLTASNGIFRYDGSTDRFIEDNSITGGYSRGKYVSFLYRDADGDLWYSGLEKKMHEKLFRGSGQDVGELTGILNLLPDGQLMDIMYSDGRAYLLKSRFLYVVDKNLLKTDTAKVNPSFVRIAAGSDSLIVDGSFYTSLENGRRIPVQVNPKMEVPEFSYDMNVVSFEWTTPYYTEELLTEYSYILEGYDTEWSEWEGISYGNTMEAQYFRRDYKNLPYGNYTFRVKTRTLTGLSGRELDYRFTILKPWYATIIAIIGFILAGIFIIYLIIKAYTRKLKNENLRLEGIVAERTAVVVKQKEELESSIHYASRIQMALLPSEAILSENIKNYFVLFKPRDIVSGDFYWMTKKNERLYIVAADCTGHGVPGAFMSLLGMSFLDEIIDKDSAIRADEILRELRKHVIESLKQGGNDNNETKDGMDIALLVVDFKTQKIEFSGAYNPCFRVRKMTGNESKPAVSDSSEDGSMSNGRYLLETIYASKMPIGISSRMNDDFVYYDWELEKGITYYLFSDGYVDQFGGPEGRKFMKKNFKRLLLDIQDYPMDKQKELLEKNLIDWMGASPQIDDILVMGVRI